MHTISPLNRYLYFVSALLASLLLGCDGNSDSQSSAPDIVLVDLLPATTRGYLHLSHAAGSVRSDWEELADVKARPGATRRSTSCATTAAAWTW